MTDTPRIRHFYFWLAALLAIHCAVVWYFRYTSITFGDDDAGYLLLARSLSQFHYRDLQEIGAPIAVRYPPGYPVVLALWQWLAGDSLPFLILLNVGLSAATLGLLASAVRQIWSDELALGLTLVLSLSPGMGHWAGRLMSEPLFSFLVMLSLWALRGHPERTARFVFSSAMAIIAALVRTAGVGGLIGLFGYWLWRRQWARAAILAMLSAITVGTWIGWTVLAPGEAGPRSYVDQFIQNTAPTATRKSASTAPSRWAPAVAKIGARVVGTANEFLTRTIPSALSVPTVPGTVIDNVGWAVIVVLALSLGTAALGRAWLPGAGYLVAYVGMLMVWPFVPPRFLTPVIPLLMLSVFLVVLRMARGRAPENRVILVLVVVLTVGQIMGLTREYRDSYGCRPEAMIRGRCINSAERAMLRLTDWLKDSVPADTRLMSTKERPVYLFSGRQAVNFSTALSIKPSEFLSYLRSNRIDYALLTPLGYGAAMVWTRLRETCRSLAVARFEEPDAYAFRIVNPSETTDGAACRALDGWKVPPPD